MEERTLQNAFRVVSLAKLDPETLVPQSQALEFVTEDNSGPNLTLMEVTAEVADLLEKGDEQFVFRGEADDSVVLCSESAVFELKEAETSNSLLIVKDMLQGDQCKVLKNLSNGDCETPTEDMEQDKENRAHKVTVVKTFYHYLEMKPAKPGYQKLSQLLESRIMKNFDRTSVPADSLSWSIDELLDRAQCSNGELLQGLKLIDAIQMANNSWVMIDSDFRMRVVSLICNVISENSWSWKAVPKNEAVQVISDIEAELITSQVFDHYFDTNGAVKRDKICRFYGEYLLQSSTVFNLQEFLSIWQESLPIIDNEGDEPFKVSLKQLEGLSLVTKDQIRYFPEANLPIVIQDRLSILFSTKEKWTLDEITPFVINMTTPKLNVKALLTKYARGTRVNGEQIFCSKHNNKMQWT